MIAQQFYALNESEDDKSKGQGLIKESPFVFRLYATGRRYCTGLLATLELKRRQDLFSMLLALVDLSTTRDSVVRLRLSCQGVVCCNNPSWWLLSRRRSKSP